MDDHEAIEPAHRPRLVSDNAQVGLAPYPQRAELRVIKVDMLAIGCRLRGCVLSDPHSWTANGALQI